MTPQVLRDELGRVRRKLQAVLVVYGVSVVVTLLVGLVFLVGWADWVFRWNDRGVRLLLDVAMLSALGWVVYRALYVPLRAPPSDLDLALRIEERYPTLRDAFASAVQFLQSGHNPRLGSPGLQQRVVSDALGLIAQRDLSDVVRTRMAQRMALVAIGVSVMVAVLVAANARTATIALRRMLLPLSTEGWPREVELKLVSDRLLVIDHDPADPLRVGRGSALAVLVENQLGRLPRTVELLVRSGDGRVTREVLQPVVLRDASGRPHEIARTALSADRGPLEFRAVGGDDQSMPWYRMVVIPPPLIENLDVTVTPPKYTGRPAERLPSGVGHVQGLVGSVVEIAATASKPLHAAALKVKDATTPLTVDEDRLHFTARFTIGEAGLYSYWFELKDTEGFEVPEATRYEVRGVADLEPEVLITVPTSDLVVTPVATVPITVAVKDDLGLQQVRLTYRMSTGGEGTIPLHEGAERPRELTLSHEWQLAGLKLEPGMQVTFTAEATDDYDLGAPHIGRGISRTLTIVSKEDKARELLQRQFTLLEELQRAHKLQEQTREEVEGLLLQLRKAQALRPQDLDTLQRAELAQRQLLGQLGNQAGGIANRAEGILREFRDSKLDQKEIETRMENLVAELQRLGERPLAFAEQELTQARKLAQGLPVDTSSEATPLPGASDAPRATPGTGNRPRPTEPSGDAKRPVTESTTPGSTGDAPPRGAASDSGARSASPPPTDSNTRPAATKPTGKPLGSSAKPATAPPGSASADAAPRREPAPVSSGTSAKPGPMPPPNRSTTQATEEALREATRQQGVVADTLKDLLDQLANWQSTREILQEAGDILSKQGELEKETRQLAPQTLGKRLEQLTPQQQADLARLAARQLKLSQKLDAFESKLDETAGEGAPQETAVPEALREAIKHLKQRSPAGLMRDASRNLNENRLGEAGQSQQQSAEALAKLLDLLKDQSPTDAESLVKQLRDVEQQLDTLQTEQQELLQKLDKAAAQPDSPERTAELQRLRKEQQALRDKLAQAERKLERLRLERPRAATSRAQQAMRQGLERLEQGDVDEGRDELQDALDDLEQAQREVIQSREEAEAALAFEQIERLADQIGSLIDRQKPIRPETQRLHDLRVKNDGTLSRAQLRSLRELADAQQGVRDETQKVADGLTQAEVFALALKGAARLMTRVAAALADRQTDQPVQQLEQQALDRLQSIVGALKTATGKSPKGGAGEPMPMGDGEKPMPNGPPTDGIPVLAELKLLKLLQTDIRQRSAELGEKKSRAGMLTSDEETELSQLAIEQGRLADLARQLLELLTAPGE